MRKKKAQREHHYIRVVITYTDGETSANRVFKDKTKAKEYAARQRASPTVKKVTLKQFGARYIRGNYGAEWAEAGTLAKSEILPPQTESFRNRRQCLPVPAKTLQAAVICSGISVPR
jgi:hypothetical protein